MSLENFKLTTEKAAEFREYQRSEKILSGMITHRQSISRVINGETLTVEALEVEFPDGTIAVCNAEHFDAHKFDSLIGFVGYEEPFLVERVDVKNNVIMLNRIKALDILKENLWKTVQEQQVLLANFRSMNVETGKLHFNVFGQNVWMRKEDWDHTYVPELPQDINLQPGDDIELQVVRIWKDQQLIQVSRKALIPDPWIGASDILQVNEYYSGEVVNISLYERESWQGYFVKVDKTGIVIRCTPRIGLQPPASGDKVNFRLEYLNEDERKGRGSIIKVVNRRENAFNETNRYNKFITISNRDIRKQQNQQREQQREQQHEQPLDQ
ncbi:hypothetical protein [Brevibacillus reuszeri]|uniref:hypothetical protein n=1 Tax=Brevibacillus reuszeri TaxID=54915 RepID=UPI000CCC41C4|nr:hypothetical protein [Brevibacillus reuszeri]